MLLVVGKTNGRVEPKTWFRTQRDKIEWSDTNSLSTENWDALQFKAKRNLYFCGVGMTKSESNEDFVLEFKYRVHSEEDNGDDAQETLIEVDNITSPKMADNMHWFDIQQYGQQPVFCPEGHYIDVAIRSKSGAHNFHYIYSGYERNYNHIEGQEWDFTTAYSDWNEGSTDDNWGFFPFILYHTND